MGASGINKNLVNIGMRVYNTIGAINSIHNRRHLK
jgi:hypothetical protein